MILQPSGRRPAQALADWLNYFDAKYGRAGRCVDVVHPVAIGSLPRGKDPTAFLSMSAALAARKPTFREIILSTQGWNDIFRINTNMKNDKFADS